jgi:P27 family predicted phage terminase small subunit
MRIFDGTRIQRPTMREGEPVPDVSEIPSPPDWFGPWSLAAWNRMTPVLHATKLLTEADYSLFEQWCFAHDLFHQSRLELASYGISIETEKGRQANPAAKLLKSSVETIIKIGTLFGMGPASRVGLTAPTQDNEGDSLDKFKRTAVTG